MSLLSTEFDAPSSFISPIEPIAVPESEFCVAHPLSAMERVVMDITTNRRGPASIEPHVFSTVSAELASSIVPSITGVEINGGESE